MLLSRSPLRISFIGGGTDYPAFFERFGTGHVVGCSINKYVYSGIIPLSKFSEEKIRFTYRQTESVNKVDDLEHPVLKEILKELNIEGLVNVFTFADLPGKSGLGSSSSFTVSMYGAALAYTNQNLDSYQIAKKAVQLERIKLNEIGGLQDQFHAAIGGFRQYSFEKEKVSYSGILISNQSLKLLSTCSLLLHVGTARPSFLGAKSHLEKLIDEKYQKAMINQSDIAMNLSVKLQESNDFDSIFTEICNAITFSDEVKKDLGLSIVGDDIRDLQKELRTHGAIATKLLGAGVSGFLLVLAEPKVIKKLLKMYPNSAEKFEFTTTGLKVVKTF